MTRVRLLFVVSVVGLIIASASVSVRAQPPVPTRPKEMTVVELVRAVENSIVRVDVAGVVTVLDVATNTPVDKELDMTAGTGFVIRTQREGENDLDVFIVTNEHVANWSSDAFKGNPVRYVKPCLGRRLAAELVGFDKLSDLALLKIRVSNLAKNSWRALEWSPGITQVGEDVIAVGFGQALRGAPSVTKGIVSAKDRFLTEVGRKNGRFAGLIQTDAAINPGNSGGPLINLRGEVVGVNTFRHVEVQKNIATGAETKAGLGVGIYYARDSMSAQVIVQKLMSDGQVVRPALGLTVRTLTETESNKNDVIFDCVEVESVEKNSPAAVAGIEPGDRIGTLTIGPPQTPINFGGMLVRSEGEWNDALARCPSDDKTLYLFVFRKKGGNPNGEFIPVPIPPKIPAAGQFKIPAAVPSKK